MKAYKKIGNGCVLLSAITIALTSFGVPALVIFTQPKCKGEPALVVPLNKKIKCVSYSYVDSKGETFTGSINNIRPDYKKNKAIYDKFPFTGNCKAEDSVWEGKQIVNLNYSVPMDGTCQEAKSHEGPVYEKFCSDERACSK